MTKSERTRAHIQETALRMFVADGFGGVTVEDIAAEAGVSHMTFYRHFPTKESVVLDDPYDPMIGASVAAQDPGLPPLERVRLGFIAVLSQMNHDGDTDALNRIRLAVHNRSLRSRIWENNQQTEQVIVEALVDSGTPHDEACVAAGAVLGAITAALINWAREDAPATLQQSLVWALEQVTWSPARTPV